MNQPEKQHGPTPPQDWEAECALIGAMILDGRVIGEIEPMVRPEDFSSDANRIIFGVLVKMFNESLPIDMVQLNGRIRDAGKLEKVGGLEYLLSLAEAVPSAVTAPYYARRVADCATTRRIISAGEEMARRAYRDPGDPDDLLDAAEQSISEIRQSRTTSDGVQSIGEILDETYARIISGGEFSHSTGFNLIDDSIGGLRPGEVIIVGARPSMGKTAFGLSIMRNLAIRSGIPTALFSLEMSRNDIANRLLSMLSDVFLSRIRSRQLVDRDFEALREASNTISAAPIVVDDAGGLSIMELRARARQYVSRHKVAVIVIDYLQLMNGGRSRFGNRQEEVGAISRGLKSLAKELAVPIICLAQLNRGNEDRSGQKPRISDLRESGSIEQDADAIILLHRESYYAKDGDSRNIQHDRGVAIIGKSRNGPTGQVWLDFHAPTADFHQSMDQMESGGREY
jgi:replicative DNA helicase